MFYLKAMAKEGPQDLQTLYRVFNLIKLLSAPPYYTAKKLADTLGVSKKTVYNYIKLLEAVGYQPDSDKATHRWSLPIDRDRRPADGLGVNEAKYLQEMLWQMPDDDPRRNQLFLWLNRQYALGPVIESLTRYTPAEHRKSLTGALESNQRVHLVNYRRADGTISPSRYLEPVAFQKNFTYLYAYDLDIEAYRQFHLSRIGYVEVLEETITGDHIEAIPDLFGWTGPAWINIQLELTDRAKQLLLEEYPEARPYVVARGPGRWVADIRAKGFVGVGKMGFRALLGGDGAGWWGWGGVSEVSKL